ncbi:MAG: MBL fold metallo-hydrolase [Planctomycetes bacterium]|nr:MBL fold metallo-hydrolase [Planctomycetota bacterium]MCD7897736.1 MBL fold metallo-hydrolase [Planctomycetaceae bacterium]
MPVCDHVHLIGGVANGTRISHDIDANVYLVDCGDGYVLIDCGGGCETERIADNLSAAGFTPDACRRILLTHAHADHAAGAAWLHAYTGAPVQALPEAARFLRDGDRRAVSLDIAIAAGVYPEGFPFPACPAEEIADGDSFRLGNVTITAVATPGHCSGHAAFLAEMDGRRILFAGDAVFPGGKIAVQPIWDCSPFAYARSMAKLAALRVDALVPSHHGWNLTTGHEDIAAAAAVFARLGVPENA